RDNAGSPDPVLPPVPISAAGDAGCGRDSEGIRSRVIGPASGSRGPRRIRRGSGRSGRLLHGSSDAIPRDGRTGPDDPGPPWTAKGAKEDLSLLVAPAGISRLTRRATAVYGGWISLPQDRVPPHIIGNITLTMGKVITVIERLRNSGSTVYIQY